MTGDRRDELEGAAAPRTAVDVVNEFLEGAFRPEALDDVVERLVANDATYVSLNVEDTDLKHLMPWAGTKRGKAAFAANFSGVTTRWTVDDFRITDTIEEADKVALFGVFTLRSVTLGQAATSALAVFAKVDRGRITFFQYMEDTFTTARTFRSTGTWTMRADPRGGEIQV